MKSWNTLLKEPLPKYLKLTGKEAIAELAEQLNLIGPSEPRFRLFHLLDLIAQCFKEYQNVRISSQNRFARLNAPGSEEDRKDALIEELVEAYPQTLNADLAATERWLDAYAVRDRDRVRLQLLVQKCEILSLFCAAAISDQLLLPGHTDHEMGSLNGIEAGALSTLGVVQNTSLPWHLRVSACKLLKEGASRFQSWGPYVRQGLWERANDPTDDVWVQAESLEAYITIRQRSGAKISKAIQVVLDKASDPEFKQKADHMFVRARAAKIAVKFGSRKILNNITHETEPSKYVRSSFARFLAQDTLNPADSLELVANMTGGNQKDPVDLVRAEAIKSLLRSPLIPAAQKLQQAKRSLKDKAELVLKTTLEQLICLLESHDCKYDQLKPDLIALKNPLRKLTHHPDRDLQERSSLSLAWLRITLSPELWDASETLEHWVKKAGEGQKMSFQRGPVACLSLENLTLIITALAADGFDLSATPHSGGGFTIYKGSLTRPSLWRVLHEIRHPSPDKRQSFSHLNDSYHPGNIIALSSRHSEVTKTRVPGQRVSGPLSLDWGPELPLPSMISRAARSRQTLVSTPGHLIHLQRTSDSLNVRMRSSFSYTSLSSLRETLRKKGLLGIKDYYQKINKLGLKVNRHQPPWLLSLVPLPGLDKMLSEFLREDNNSVMDLLWASLGFAGYFVGQHVWHGLRINRWRKKIPLVIGGWGSRGKSGTERLKAALFFGLGCRVFSKTTGCEAMFVIGLPGGEPTEIFLFRPFEKATIWEQRSVVKAAADMNAQVFLWECMALNPAYVDILQHDWMQDDYSTITNTYPDHEDIQGPSGRNVADVISRFIPKKARVFTTEEHMLPVLKDQARDLKTKIRTCDWSDSALISDEILRRFPYDEHPKNIALVATLAQDLGVEQDVALKLLADYVVPDLGVLKEYGPVEFEGRTVSFVNGMSANERAGFLSNWERTRFSETFDDKPFDHQLVVVINNRSDRLARQEVFASIAAVDINPDLLVVIGTNIRSFSRSYEKKLLSELRESMGYQTSDHENTDGFAALADLLSGRLRRPVKPQQEILDQLRVRHPEHQDEWLSKTFSDFYQHALNPDGLSPDASALDPWTARWLTECCWINALASGDLDMEPKEAITISCQLFLARMTCLQNPAATGDYITSLIARNSPPKSRVRILGAANIKGTGLDLVYRWINIGQTLEWIEILKSNHFQKIRKIVPALLQNKAYGVIEARLISETINHPDISGKLRMLGLATETEELSKIASEQLEINLQKLVEVKTSSGRSVTIFLVGVIEKVIDFLDSVGRRKKTDQLYKDLAHGRVSLSRAAIVAKKLQYRQYGGWLKKSDKT